MSLRGLLQDEIKRAPIALSLSVIMTIVAVAGLWIAWQQPSHVGASSQTGSTHPAAGRSSLSVWLTITLFLSVTGVGASASRLLYKANGWVAWLSSGVLAVLSLFLTTWAAARLGLDTSRSQAGQAFGNLIFYGTLIIYLGIAGGRPLLDLGRTGYRKHETALEDQNEALGTFVMLVIGVALWGALVGAGQTAAAKAFL